MEEIVWCLGEIVKDYIGIVLDLEIRKREPGKALGFAFMFIYT